MLRCPLTERVCLGTVVFLYECIITIGGEVELFWFAKSTGANILYLLNRYIVGFYSIYILATSFVPVSQEVCISRTMLPQLTEVLGFRGTSGMLRASRSALKIQHSSCNASIKFVRVISVMQYLPWAGMQAEQCDDR